MNQTDGALDLALLHRTDCADWNDYILSVAQDYEQIEPFLPQKVDSILDIGCGLAGIDILLKQKYPDARLMLLDGDGPKEDFRGGFKKTMAPFSSRGVTEAFLKANGVTIDRWIDVNTTETLKADLVISLLSWGWHYPLETYKVKSPLVIFDSRAKKENVIRRLTFHGKNKGYRCLTSTR